jgi:hypothetical protein
MSGAGAATMGSMAWNAGLAWGPGQQSAPHCPRQVSRISREGKLPPSYQRSLAINPVYRPFRTAY